MTLKYALVMSALLSMATNQAQAGVIVGASRVVYEADKKEESLSVRNPEEKKTYLIQTWVENEVATNTEKTPFIITPPLVRLDPGQENLQRIIFTGAALPADRESVYWLNVKSIPSSEKSDVGRLLISINTRIKLFYRPAELPGDPNEAYKQLSLTVEGNQLRITNPTPYHVSFFEVKVGDKRIEDAGMISPKSTATRTVPSGASGKITWKAINDYGGISEEATL